jgi:hypothetical protein
MMRLRGVVVAAIAASGLVGGLLACSGSDSTPSIGSSDSGPAGEAAADTGSTPYTLDDVCDRTAPLVCGIRKDCCAATGGFDETGCEAHSKAECQKDVTEARAGRETFHPDRIDACIPKLTSLLSGSCYVTFDLILKFSEEYKDCRIFEGSLAEAASCERDSQCKPPANPNDIVGCDDKTKVCHTTHLAAENDPCTIADGLPTICGRGLYCDANFALPTPSGTCKKATAIGDACSTSKTPNLECGFGNYCEKATGKCTAGKPANASCTSDLECQTISCRGPDGGVVDGGGACTAPGALVKPEECKGP